MTPAQFLELLGIRFVNGGAGQLAWINDPAHFAGIHVVNPGQLAPVPVKEQELRSGAGRGGELAPEDPRGSDVGGGGFCRRPPPQCPR
ncbi:unnamed protein product [Bursaphelenchus xylophilus]|uniref:(pine wood nematode) hypothetical protein n=1 Tax=Bursaphelenchus xylophilus TaxID=6326 RepID=A0A1I7RX93_BURXY|nr:unnamed protein product [Bursaphelenchus xylophilus]CAG9121447.1 unnamed protein product [Bursaphelenchus xylophilus]